MAKDLPTTWARRKMITGLSSCTFVRGYDSTISSSKYSKHWQCNCLELFRNRTPMNFRAKKNYRSRKQSLNHRAEYRTENWKEGSRTTTDIFFFVKDKIMDVGCAFSCNCTNYETETYASETYVINYITSNVSGCPTTATTLYFLFSNRQ